MLRRAEGEVGMIGRRLVGEKALRGEERREDQEGMRPKVVSSDKSEGNVEGGSKLGRREGCERSVY